jgi:hypothetical protein
MLVLLSSSWVREAAHAPNDPRIKICDSAVDAVLGAAPNPELTVTQAKSYY